MASREFRPIIISPVTIEKVVSSARIHGRDPDDVSMQSGLGYFRGIHGTPGRGSGYVFECAICGRLDERSNHLTGRPVDDQGTGYYDFSESPRHCLRQAIEASRSARNQNRIWQEPRMRWGNCCDHSWFVNACCIDEFLRQLVVMGVEHTCRWEAISRTIFEVGCERGDPNDKNDGLD